MIVSLQNLGTSFKYLSCLGTERVCCELVPFFRTTLSLVPTPLMLYAFSVTLEVTLPSPLINFQESLALCRVAYASYT